MKIKRSISIFLMLTLLAFTLPVESIAAQMDFVDALFTNVDSSGCITTEVSVFAQSGKADVSPMGSLRITRVDYCDDGRHLLDLQSSWELSSNKLKLDSKLASATLVANIVGIDAVSNKNIDIDINLTWNAISESVVNITSSYFQQSGLLVKDKNKYSLSYRNAQASGSITDGATNFILKPSSDAGIGGLDKVK